MSKSNNKKNKKKCPTCGRLAFMVYKDGTCCHCNNKGATKEALKKACSKKRVCKNPNCRVEFLGHAKKALCPKCDKIRVEVICANPNCKKKFKLSARDSLEYLTGRKKDRYFCCHNCSRGGYKYCDVCKTETYFAGWNTCLKHNNPFSRKEVQEKCKETIQQHFGTDNVMQSEKGKELSRKGCEAIYGEGIINPFQADKVKEKCKKTISSKYGVDNVFQSKIIQKQIKDSYKEKTGYDYPPQNPEVKEKMKATYKERTGFDYPSQNPEVKEKIKNNYKKKTGFDNPMQNPEVLRKNYSKGSTGIRTKLVFPSKFIVTRSWWETIFALYLYYNSVVFEYEVLDFEYIYNEKKCVYIPDFYLPEFNYIVEIKGYQRDPNRDIVAWKTVLDADYGFEVIRGIKFFESWLNDNFNINLNSLRESSKECNDIFEFVV